MKNNILRSFGLLTILLMATGIFSLASAQAGHARFRGGDRPMVGKQMENLKLTEDQQKQMAELKAKFQQEALNVNNLIKEKQAHIKTLLDMETPDASDLDKTIDVLSNLKGELMKKGIAHRDAVKKILTPDQMKIWDIKAKQRMQGMRQGPGQGRGQGHPGMIRGERPMRGSMQMGGRGMQMEGKEIEVEGKPVNIERKVIIVEGKPIKVTNMNIKEKKTDKKKKIEKEDR